MKWSQLKKRVEATFADSVRGRVEVWNTRYRKSHDQEGEAWITIDKKQAHSFGTCTFWAEVYRKSQDLEKEHNCHNSIYQSLFEIDKELYYETLQTIRDRGQQPSWEFNGILFDYLNKSMDDILTSENPIIRAFGMLDKRLGKRCLRALKVKDDHPLVHTLYEFRCSSEGINISNLQQSE